MSERSISPTDYYELKHVKSIQINQTSIKKRASIHQKSNQELQLELNKCNLSCECSNCGKPTGFQLKIHGELPLKETRYQKKNRILKKLKAIGNAIIFILLYKSEAIKKWKKKMHNLKLSKNLTILRRPAVLQSVPNAQPNKQFINNPKESRPFDSLPVRPKSRHLIENLGFVKHGNELFSEQQRQPKNRETKNELKRLVKQNAIQKTVQMCSCKSQNEFQNIQDEEVLMNESVHRVQQSNQKVARKSSIQLYLEKIFKNGECVIKKDNNIKPLTIFNDEINKSKNKNHYRSISQLYLNNYQSQLVPCYEKIRTTTNSSYYNNKQYCIKPMGLIKNKVIKIKR